MSGCHLCVYLLLLVVYSAGKPWQPSLELFGAIGSSVVLTGPGDEEAQNVQHLRWEFGIIRILDYYYSSSQNATFTNFCKDRCKFYPSSGSLMLENLTTQDQGLYKVDVDLNADKSRVIKLTVMEQLTSPSITTTSAMVDMDINLTCQVTGGKASSVRWMKDDQMIANNDETYHFRQNNCTLLIPKAQKSNCGAYTCILENRVSKANGSYHLFIHGIPSLHYTTLGFSIAALIFGCTVFIGIIVSCLQKENTAISLPSHQNILLFLQFAAILSLVILMAAFCFWGQTLGYPNIIMTALVILSLLLILIFVAMCSMKSNRWDWFNIILSTKICRIVVDVVTPVGGLIVITLSGILITEILKQAGKGCESPGNLRSSILPAIIVPLVVFVLFFGIYAMLYTKHKQQMRTGPEDRNQQRDCDNVPLNEIPEPVVPISRNPAQEEEMPRVETPCLQDVGP
ncbi:uncharacterized protein LOC144602736 [Rhinoraja longicauda]